MSNHLCMLPFDAKTIKQRDYIRTVYLYFSPTVRAIAALLNNKKNANSCISIHLCHFHGHNSITLSLSIYMHIYISTLHLSLDILLSQSSISQSFFSFLGSLFSFIHVTLIHLLGLCCVGITWPRPRFFTVVF